MSHTSKLEDVIALSEDGDEVVIKRVYDPKTNYALDSHIGGNIYHPSNKIIVDGQVIILTLDNWFHHPKNGKIYSV